MKKSESDKLRCIFCKEDTSKTKSREHIIPESLGNKSQILPKGSVCDKCNNHFAVKVEGKLLNQPYFKSVRHRMLIESKKGNIPVQDVMLISNRTGKAAIAHSANAQTLSIIIEDKALFENILDNSLNNNTSQIKMIVPINNEPDKNNQILSRFLAKIAIESMTMRLSKIKGWNEEIVGNESLDLIRNYARYAKNTKFWIYNQRRIYKENNIKRDPENGQYYQSLNETGFLQVAPNIFYFIAVIFGIEYAINLSHPEIALYEEWLINNDNRCPLENYIVSNNTNK